MNLFKQVKNLLPETLGSRIIAIFGYLVAAFGLEITYEYLSELTKPCVNTNAEFSEFIVLVCVGQLAAAIYTFHLINGLKKRRNNPFIVVTILITILFIEVGLALGMGFAIGTACS